MAGQKISLNLLTPSRSASGGGRPATGSNSTRPACFLTVCTLQLCSPFPQIISVSGGYFVGKACLLYAPPLHPPFGPYNQLPTCIRGVRKTLLQASIHNSISIPLISLKISKSLGSIPSTPPSSTTTTSFPAARKVSQRPKKL